MKQMAALLMAAALMASLTVPALAQGNQEARAEMAAQRQSVRETRETLGGEREQIKALGGECKALRQSLRESKSLTREQRAALKEIALEIDAQQDALAQSKGEAKVKLTAAKESKKTGDFAAAAGLYGEADEILQARLAQREELGSLLAKKKAVLEAKG